MTYEEIEELFEQDRPHKGWEGDNAFQGLQILSKYSDNLIQGAGHDVIWSLGIDELEELEVTKKDLEALIDLNWHLDEGGLACFV